MIFSIDIFIILLIIQIWFLYIIHIPMKKIMLVFSLVALSFPLCSFAKQWCCSWHGWVAYCASNGRYVCNDWTYSPSCTCWTSSTTYYNITNYLTNDQKCNMKYPGTVYRYSDNWCACKWDKKWTSSWSSIYGCTKNTTNNFLSLEDIQCNYKYPWTIYRSSDGWCACPWDKKWTSSRKKTSRSC